MAHLRFDFPFQVDRAAFAAWVQQATGKTLRDELQTASFHLQADTPDGRFHLQVYASGIDTTAGAPDSPEGLLYRMIPDAEVARALAARQDPNEISLIFRACGEMTGSRDAPVHAPGTSWIDLASEADRDAAFDHARAFVHYADQAAAPIWQRMRDACVALATEMGGHGIAPHDPHEVGSTWHDSGTLFIGDDPGASVTDTSGRFHHIANAACVDQALFPTVGSANPVLTGLCLARKAAEAIVARHVSAPAPDAAEIAAEKAEGFTFLLESAEAGKWVPNDARLTASRPALIEGGTIIEVHGDAGLGVLFYDEPALFPGLRAAAAMEGVPGRRDRGRGRELRHLPARAAAGPAPRRRQLLQPGDRDPDRRHRLRSRRRPLPQPAASDRRRLWNYARVPAGGKGRKHGWHAGLLERLPRRGDRLPHRGHAEWPLRQRGRASAATHPAGHAGAPVSQRESAIPGSPDTPPVSGLPEFLLAAQWSPPSVRPRQGCTLADRFPNLWPHNGFVVR